MKKSSIDPDFYEATCEERSYGDPHLDSEKIWAKYHSIQNACKKHAESCRSCQIAIMDDEGNPQFFSEACPTGYQLLTEYYEWENKIFDLLAGSGGNES